MPPAPPVPPRPPVPPVPGHQQTILCESYGNSRVVCQAQGRIESVILQTQRSSTTCVYGYNWGYDSNSIWVDRGCRAVFLATLGRGGPIPQPRTVTKLCESVSNRYTNCAVTEGRVLSVRVSQQRSNAACSLNYSFGHDDRSIWVDRGCRAYFEVTLY